MEEKDIYIDSEWKEHVIADMPSIMIYYVVVKHGKNNLVAQGYKKMTDRFDNIVKNAGVVESIKSLGGN